MKLKIILENVHVPKQLLELKGDIALVAQEIYDKWDENEDEYAGGGICHLIADEIVHYLEDHQIEATPFSCSVGENHVMVAARFGENAYIIDIPPHIYETGGGYSWQKVPDVKITANDVTMELAPGDFEEYLD